jgi:hypothetical protein
VIEDAELSVRLEWPERSTVPFRPSTDEPADPPAPGEDAVMARLARLEGLIDGLQQEIARLHAEIARLRGSSAPEVGDAPIDPPRPPLRAGDGERPRPIRVRPKPRSREAG